MAIIIDCWQSAQESISRVNNRRTCIIRYYYKWELCYILIVDGQTTTTTIDHPLHLTNLDVSFDNLHDSLEAAQWSSLPVIDSPGSEVNLITVNNRDRDGIIRDPKFRIPVRLRPEKSRKRDPDPVSNLIYL